MDQKAKRGVSGQIRGVAILCLTLLGLFFLTYKAELQKLIYGSVRLTLSSLHKPGDEFDVILDSAHPYGEEVFLNPLPELKTISFRVSEPENAGETLLQALLTDSSGREILREQFRLSELSDVVKLRIPSGFGSLKDQALTLRVSLEGLSERADTSLILTANKKQGMVSAFDQDKDDRTNIISEMTYADGQRLKAMYVILCALLTVFMLIAYYLLLVRKWQLSRAYLPLALILGSIFTFLIPAYSVPDENIHMDNAYKYSNMIMGTGSTKEAGTIMKRSCDVLQADLMANTLESNHYMQLRDHLFDRPSAGEKELVKVDYLDAGVMVPAINYIPCALGISLGRALGTSSVLTLSIGRYFSAVAFILLVWLALKLLPYGRNAAALLMLLPIALQQGASASYDSLMNGMLLLFISCWLNIHEKIRENGRSGRGGSPAQAGMLRNVRGSQVLIPGMGVVLALYVARTKGGVYLPLYLLPAATVADYVICERKRNTVQVKKKKDRTQTAGSAKVLAGVALLGILAAVVFVFIRSFWSFLTPMFNGSYQGRTGQGSSLLEVLKDPVRLIYIYWRTFKNSGELYLRGLMGGTLSWQDISLNRLYPLGFLGGTILLAHTQRDRFEGKKWFRLVLIITSALCVMLILLSMLVAYTDPSLDHITGVQGRYFLGFAILFFLTGTTKMIRAEAGQASSVAFAMMLLETMSVLDVVTKV